MVLPPPPPGYDGPIAIAYGVGVTACGGTLVLAYGAAYSPARAKTAVAAPQGVAYSAAPPVAQLSFSGLGVTCGYLARGSADSRKRL
jgi:hypothetical protein